MTAPSYELSPEAQNDLFEIWSRIAEDSVELANRIESEFYELFQSLAQFPGQGHSRRDLTSRPVLFIALYSFLIIYRSDPKPVRIMAIVRGSREIGRFLKGRS